MPVMAQTGRLGVADGTIILAGIQHFIVLVGLVRTAHAYSYYGRYVALSSTAYVKALRNYGLWAVAYATLVVAIVPTAETPAILTISFWAHSLRPHHVPMTSWCVQHCVSFILPPYDSIRTGEPNDRPGILAGEPQLFSLFRRTATAPVATTKAQAYSTP